MSLRSAEPSPAAAAALRPTRSLAAVLAAGQQHQEAATALSLFGKTDYAKKFREALMKLEDKPKKEADVKEAAAKLTTEQIKELETEFKAYEEAGWTEMATNAATKHLDSWKGQMARVEAQQKVLRAHYGLGALHTFTKDGEYTVAMPMQPENMGYVYHALSRWPNADFRRGTDHAWASLRNIGDYLEKSNDVVRQKERQRG